jgi:cell division protein FtsB
MLEFQHKRRIRKIMYSPVVILLLLIIAIVFVRAAWNIYEKEAQSRAYLEQAQSQLSNMQSQEKILSQSVASLGTPQGKDAEIRSEYLVVKPGEQVAVMVDDEASDTAATSSAEVSPGGFWARITGFFGF